MNTIIPFKLIWTLLLLIPLITFANNTVVLKNTSEEKKISKSFKVAPNATLKVANSFGNIDITTWDKNQIDMQITVKVTGNDADKVKDRLDRINIVFNESNNMVSVMTKIEKNRKNWWNWGKKMNLKIEINYTIIMPITNNVNLSNSYGAINLATLKGRAEIQCDYGKITTQALMAENNIISFDYTNNSYFEYLENATINADYSEFTVANTKSLRLNADYTKSVIENSENVEYNCDYGSLKIDNANNINGNGDYLTLRLGNIYKNVSISADYGSVKIERIASKAENIKLNSNYTGITIGIDADYNFNFNVNLSYASLKAPKEFNFTKKYEKSFSKQYSGYYGSNNSGNEVSINSDYGSITFKQNTNK